MQTDSSLHSHILQKLIQATNHWDGIDYNCLPMQELNVVTKLIIQIASKAIAREQPQNMTRDEPDDLYLTKVATYIASRKDRRLRLFFKHHFPFSQVAEDLAEEALTINSLDEPGQVLNYMLKVRLKEKTLIPETSNWKKIQQFFQQLPLNMINHTFNENYKELS
ncbi:MAG: hypothetical protein Q8K60_05155, partial [Parachlamydiaceae bacterium]|nr:hypothetical protein [Parachlamydiaceae bacterium]